MGSREVGCQVIYIVQALGLERAWGCISCQCRQRNCVPSSTHRILAAFILAGNLEALAAALSWARCVEGAAGGERAHRPEGVHCFAQESVATAALQYAGHSVEQVLWLGALHQALPACMRLKGAWTHI